MVYCATFTAHASQGLQPFQEKTALHQGPYNHTQCLSEYTRLLGGWGRGLTVLRLRWTSPIPIHTAGVDPHALLRSRFGYTSCSTSIYIIYSVISCHCTYVTVRGKRAHS